jgi:hypothetical protein
VFKVGEGRFSAGPLVAPRTADFAGRYRAHELGVFGQGHGFGAPAAQHGRIQQHHTGHAVPAQLGVARSAHQTQKAAERMAHQPSRLAVFFDLWRGEVGELLHQMRPVAGDGVVRVVAELFDGAHGKAA